MDVLGETRVEVSSESEEKMFPITSALSHEVTNGWRAATTGPQMLRLVFPAPRRVKRVRVHAVDRVSERTQEMVVRAGASVRELVEVARWEFSFSRGGARRRWKSARWGWMAWRWWNCGSTRMCGMPGLLRCMPR